MVAGREEGVQGIRFHLRRTRFVFQDVFLLFDSS